METFLSGNKRGQSARQPEDTVRTRLQRLALELPRRRSSAPESSRDYYLRAARWLASLRSTNDFALRLECLEQCAAYFYTIGDKPTTLSTTSVLHALAMQSGLKEWRRKAHSYRGIAYADVGDLYQSLLSYGEALRAARELRSQKDEALVLSNMGTALMLAGFNTDSMHCFQRAFDLGMADAGLPLACVAACNMAQICFREGNHALGVEHIERALKLEAGFPGAQYNLHRVILESNYVQLAVGLGDEALASRRLALCEEFALKAQTQRATLIARLARGLCEVNHGNGRKGVAILKAAGETTSPMTDEWVDCNLFLIRGLEKVGDFEQALHAAKALTEGLTTLCESGVQALAHDRLVPAQSLRRDHLESLTVKRSRLETMVARSQAAQARWETIERLAMMAELKGDPSGLHGYRVGKLSRLFAEHLRLNAEVIEHIEVAGRLHDIGKVAVPDQVLRGTMPPSRAEMQVLHAHATIGGDLLVRSTAAELQCAELVARHHHERWDGEGYPSRMSGKQIPVACRIVAIADCFDAMTHGRPHVRPVAAKVALAEIQLQAGRQFDPDLASAFVEFARELMTQHSALSEVLERGSHNYPAAAAVSKLDEILATVRERDGERGVGGSPFHSAPPFADSSNRRGEPL